MTEAFGSTNAIVPGGSDVNPFAATAAPNNGSSSPVNANAALQTPGTMGGNGTTTSPVKLTANTSNAGASTTQTVPAPVVVNSQAATSYLGNVGQQVGNLQQNQQSQSAATAPVAPAKSAGSGSSTPTTPTTSTSSVQPPADPTDQMNAILSSLTGTENSANANANPQEPKDTYSAQEVQAIWGSNTNGLTQNSDGTFTASPEALSSAGITDANGNATGATVNGVPTSETLSQEGNDVQTQLAQGYAKMNSDLTAIANGTYPLTPSESAMIASSQQQMIQALQMQATANTSYTGAVGESLASTGGLMGAQQMGIMQGAIAIGQQRTADLNSRLTQAIASLQDSFMKEDYTNVQDQWANTSKYFDDRASAISDMQKTVATQVQSIIANAQKDAETNISAIMDSANFGQKSYEDAYAQTQDAIKNAVAQGTLDEKTAADLASEATARITAEKGTYQVKTNPDGTTSIFNTATGQEQGGGIVSSGGTTNADPTQPLVAGTGNNLSLNSQFPEVNSAFTTSSFGVPYIDTSNLSAAGKLQAAEVAQEYQNETGNPLPMVTAKNATVVQNIDDAKSNLDDMTGIITDNNLASSNFATRPFNSALQSVEGATQADADLSGLTSYALSAISLAKTLGATGRLNQQEINLASKSLPQASDTVAVVQQKLANLSKILGNAQSSILGSQAFDAANPSPSSNAINNYLSSNSGTTASGSTPAVNPAFTQLDAQFGLQ